MQIMFEDGLALIISSTPVALTSLLGLPISYQALAILFQLIAFTLYRTLRRRLSIPSTPVFVILFTAFLSFAFTKAGFTNEITGLLKITATVLMVIAWMWDIQRHNQNLPKR